MKKETKAESEQEKERSRQSMEAEVSWLLGNDAQETMVTGGTAIGESVEKQGKEVVDLSVQLNPDNRILIISGPNAGGKSVSLKTIGLLQYMLQNGLLIPAMPDSQCGIFKNLFIALELEINKVQWLSTEPRDHVYNR